MNGVSHDLWDRMKALGRRLDKCRTEMEKISENFAARGMFEEEDEDLLNAAAGIGDAVDCWWAACDRYHAGELVEAKLREAGDSQDDRG